MLISAHDNHSNEHHIKLQRGFVIRIIQFQLNFVNRPSGKINIFRFSGNPVRFAPEDTSCLAGEFNEWL